MRRKTQDVKGVSIVDRPLIDAVNVVEAVRTVQPTSIYERPKQIIEGGKPLV
jgi:hypothetical protein